jgi:hypothetical protein
VSNTNEHAEVGALLARCEFASVLKNAEYGWAAFVKITGIAGSPSGYGPTQLAAIRAAVEAAEKGVRE